MQQQQASRGYSLVQDSGTYTSSCGYCNGFGSATHGKRSSKTSHGMHAYRLTVYDYQELLDQGWRRSGKYLYKPDNKITCCKQYTIRLDVTQHRPSKAQKRLLRKWEQFLAGQLHHEEAEAEGDVHMPGAAQEQTHQPNNDSGTQRGPKRTRQSSSATTPTAAAAASAGAGTNKQQQQQQQQQQPGIAGEVEALLQQAVQHLVQQGCLPQQALPAVKVVAPAANKLSKLPAGTLLTSSSAHALAAAARKLQQQQHEPDGIAGQPGTAMIAAAWGSADGLAELLANAFNARAAAVQAAPLVMARAAQGHLNFSAQQQQQQQQETEQKHQQQAQHDRGQQSCVKQQAAQQQQDEQQTTQHHRPEQAPPPPQQRPQQQQPQQGRHPSHQQAPLQQQQQQQPQQGAVRQPHQLQVVMVPNQFIQEEYELYCKYQVQQHNDTVADLTPSRYKNFLVDTPLIPVPPLPSATAAAAGSAVAAPATTPSAGGAAAAAAAGGGAAGVPACGYGSFHQQYWLDGKLVAVGVVDVLPRCLSSKYYFWDPDYAWLSLGRYGALREIDWVQQAHAGGAADLRYYYLGYYIHSCPKMAYKAEYAPSELLCPQRQVWVGLDATVRAALDAASYVVLSDLPDVRIAQNLSVPRELPAPDSAAVAAGAEPCAAAAAAAGSAEGIGAAFSNSSATAAGVVAPQQLGLPAQLEARQRQRHALDLQLLFLTKQPVRWGALRESGALDGEQVEAVEERLTEWQAVVGETAAHLLYVTPSDLLYAG